MSEHIQNSVGRCYNISGQDLGLTPNPLDGENPPMLFSSTSSVGPVAPSQTPAEIIAGLVGRCYGSPVIGDLSNKPNSLDGENPRPVLVTPDVQPPPSPAEVIQGLVGRCYPALPAVTPPKNIPTIPDEFLKIDLPYIPDLIKPYFPLIIKPPTPGSPIFGFGGDDCERVFKLQLRQEIVKLGNGYWRVKATGEKLFCAERESDFDWENCVRNALECTFRPYIGGTWRPPKTDCNTYWPNGWSANKDKICVDNCYPDRFPVYESTRGNQEEYNYTTDLLLPSNAYSLTSSTPAFHILQEEIPGSTVPLFKYRGNGGDFFLTTNPGAPDGPGQGERESMNTAGMIFQNILGHVFPSKDKAISYLGKDEQIYPLHRFYRSPLMGPVDHKYTIDAEIPGEPPRALPKRSAYRIPADVRYDLTITMDVEKGSAGYNNALGVYVADSTGPKSGVVIVKSAKSGEDITIATVSATLMQQYKGGTIGFFLIPNGGNRNTLTIGQNITFVPHNNNGFRGVGIATNEGDYCLFSDFDWNKGKKDQTKWRGDRHQMWEDLINGDDDYDDLRLWHKLEWTINGYIYEGIQCYVYEGAGPPQTYAPKYQPNNCDPRGLRDSFRDVVVTRQGCGHSTPTIESTAPNDIECGKCTGGYSSKLEVSQTIQAAMGGRFKIKSYGGITGGIRGDCTKYTFAFKKNGAVVFQSTFEARYWPAIGRDISSTEIVLTPNDTIGFEFISLDSGPVNGVVQPSIGIFDVSRGVFESVFTLMLSTSSGDDALGRYNPSTYPGQLTNGQVLGLALQFRPRVRSAIWVAGSKEADTWSIDPDNPAVQYPYTVVIQNNILQTMPNIRTTNPEPGLWGGGHRLGTLLPGVTKAYIDTGIPYYTADKYRDGHSAQTMRRNSGRYNRLIQDHLITKWERLSGNFSSADQAMLKKITPTLFAKKKTVWYEVDPTITSQVSQLYNGSTVSRNTYYSPHTFIHDYFLDPSNQKAGAGFVYNQAKVRVAFTFYCDSTPQLRRQWFCVIQVLEILKPGHGYSIGQEFELSWPPIRNNKNEDTSESPFFPDQVTGFKMPRKLTAYWEDATIVKRAAKQAFYQESHNKDSPVWYTSSDKKRFRVNFKIILTEVSS